MLEFKLPELGENIETGTVLSINVSVGDTVKEEQDLLELETDKATIPIPSPCDGVIKDILVKKGDEIQVGAVMFKIESTAGSVKEEAPTNPQSKTKVTPQEQSLSKIESNPGSQIPRVDTSKDTQVVVIGGGPGGYPAAFLAADLGMHVTLVDMEPNPGGVCVYRGCIPSKALLHVTKILSEAKHAKNLGIDFGTPKIDLNKLRDWKNDVVKKLTTGTGMLRDQRKIKFIQGRARFVDSNTITIDKSDGKKEKLTFQYAILATGSQPIKLPFQPNSKRILDSTTALDIEDIPKSLLVIGGGYIGLELGSVYAELGSDVSVVEMTPNLLPGADKDLVAILAKRVKNVFSSIMLETKVTKMNDTKEGVEITFEDKRGKKNTQTFEKVLVAVGRKPNSKDLGLENTRASLDEKGFIVINAQRRTADSSIYAIGDIAGEPMLAHKASHEGRIAAEAIAGEKVAFEPNAIPAVVFTDPEIAWCGLTETQAKAEERDVRIVKFPWGASGRAITLDRSDGLTKLIIDPSSERILGVAIVGVGAGEMIAEGVLAIEMGAVASDLKMSIHPHPTLTETLMESAESFYGQSTHIYRPKKK